MKNITYDKEQLEALCRKHNLKLLILHGSYAKGTATDKSDIDIGILGSKNFDQKQFSMLLSDLGGIFGDKFDPAFLNEAEPMISYQVAMRGKPLFEEPRGSFAEYKVQSLGRYMDTKKFRELEKQYIKRAVGSN